MAYKKFPPFAEVYFKATGKPLSDIMQFNDDKVCKKFRDNGLREPTKTFLKYYRNLLTSPKELIPVVNKEFAEFVEQKMGLIKAHTMTVLNSIIAVGVKDLASNKKVGVKDLLHALELKLKYPDGGEVKNIKKRLYEIFTASSSITDAEYKEEGENGHPDKGKEETAVTGEVKLDEGDRIPSDTTSGSSA